LKSAIDCSFIPGKIHFSQTSLRTKITVIEKRDHFSRNNVLHLWPYAVSELQSIGVKTFYRQFCSGGMFHIGIKRLQFILFKIGLLLGVQYHFGNLIIHLTQKDTVSFPSNLL
jgi:hypothetical protein